jgi:hypothetical protein
LAIEKGNIAEAEAECDQAEVVAEYVGVTMTEDPPEEPLGDPVGFIRDQLAVIRKQFDTTDRILEFSNISMALDELVANHAREVEQLKARLRVVESGASRAMIAAIDATEKAIDVAAEESP